MLIVIQLIMFGMGTQMKWSDFTNVLKMPLGVMVGITCQFTIMPLLGYGLAKSFSFSPEIAVGLILIGSCSSGLASNVMTFLAKGNLALSVTLTAIATAMAPIMTPLWMKILASSMVHVDVVKMGLDIVNTVIVPILAAFVHDFLLAKRRWIRQGTWIVVAISTLYLLGLLFGGWNSLLDLFGMVKPSADALSEADFKTASVAYEKWVTILGLPGFVAAAFTFGAIYHLAREHWTGVAIWMPRISMAGIVYFTLVATANGRDRLLEVGAMLVLAVFLHNMLGYLLGYWCSRLLGMNRQDARTIAIEVGTQNGSMAVSLAQQMGKIGTVGLAGVIFAPMMNITGSILANHWRKTAEDPQENAS